jgi:hypothetical protein
MEWIHFDEDWFNLDDFCHIWIETRSFHETEGFEHRIKVTGYYLMGEWRHNGEEVIISQDWESIDDLKKFLHHKLDVYNGYNRE